MQKLRLTFVFVLFALLVNAQDQSFYGQLQDGLYSDILTKQFKSFQIYKIDAEPISNYLQAHPDKAHFSLSLGNEYQWDVLLNPNDMRAQNYQINNKTTNGILREDRSSNKAFNGRVQGPGGGATALTVDKDFLYGFVQQNKEVYFMEPLRHLIDDAAEDLFLVYAKSAVIENHDLKCGVDELEENKNRFLQNKENSNEDDDLAKIVACYDLELAIAADFAMYQKYGSSTTGVENHIIGVMNNVQTNYDDEFTHNVNFVIVTFWISTCNSCDPWTTSTDAGTLLNSFRSWGNGGGFGPGVTYDLAGLWTNRNFDGGTVGIAYVGVLCGNSRYHCIQDFSSAAWAMRVVTSHEIGHNLDAGHDAPGSPFIMAPAVNNTNTWSAASIAAINAHVQSRINSGCLQTCGSGAPPVADFTADTQQGCATLTVNYTDNSTGATGWFWTFEGGTPATSTNQNPTVNYSTKGTFDVTLEVSNAFGDNTIIQTDFITVEDVPETGFTHSSVELVTDFFNTTIDGDSYFWDFGDGNTSTAVNPTHVFPTDGEYVVSLTAYNNCGENTVVDVVVIVTVPFALFSSDVTIGCEPLPVQFINQSSSNATSWNWSFPGGSPQTSTDEHPLVIYDTPGIYDVVLTVGNAAGSDTYTELGYVEVLAFPTAGFTYTITGDVTVNFTNTSTDATDYLWDFGDGNTSTATNPSHTYAGGGSYDVTLIASNICDAPSVTVTIEIVLPVPPTANFQGNSLSGCATHVVEFSDLSVNATSWNWSFPGGSPASSTIQNPTVSYNNAGSFDVTLIVGNSIGADTITLNNYITVDDIPDAAFTTSANGASVDFINGSSNADTYTWDFGDGNTSTVSDPNHVYSMDGSYTVQLIATNACGNDTTEQSVTIVLPPTAGFNADVTAGCADLTVNFTNQSSANTTSWAWVFNGGNPATSSNPNPTVTYTAAGTYTVELTVSNAAGSNTLIQTAYIMVDDVPNATFNANQNGNDVTFNNSSTNATSYSWDFGDGNTSTDASPSNTYPGDGTYTVQLIATNSCGNDTLTQNITISTAPVAAFTANTTTGCADLTVNFTDQSSANVESWAWTFEGGNPSGSTAQNPTVVYQNAGVYDVVLTVTNTAGSNTVTQSGYIVVLDVPSAGFTSNVNGMQATFNNSSTNATSYNWDFGDGNTSTATNPQHTYTTDGSYTVTLTATNSCGSVTTTQTVVVSTEPTAAFSSNITSGCADLTVNFTDQSSANAVSWAWTFEGGNPATSTAQNPSVMYTTAGTYDVTLTVTNATGLTNTITQTNYVVVDDVPVAGFSSSVNGMQATFNNSSTNATSYSWDFGDGNTSTATTPQHNYAADGTYTVTLTATNSCGAVMTTQTVVISNAPTAAFSTDVTTGCASLTVNFTDQSSANAVSWAWTFEGGNPATSTAQNPTVTYTTAGTYDVTLTVTNAAGLTNTINQTNYISVDAAPVAGFGTTVNGAVVDFNNSSTNATSYSWNFGDGNTSTAANPSNTYATDGTYTVTLTASNLCGSTTTTETVTIVTPPSAGFTANVTSGCAPLTVTFTDQSSPNTTDWAWTFGGGNPTTSDQQSPTVTFDTPGVYTISLEASNSAGSNTATQTNYIVVLAAPTADFTATVNGTVANFNNSSTNATSYNWTFGDGNTSTSANPTNNYATDGVYTVTLTATGACGTMVSTQSVTIVTPPVADFSADNLQGCVPMTIDFSDLSTANATEWNWTFAGGTPASSTMQNPTVVYNAAGVYSVTLEVSNAAGNNTVTKTNYITVNALPTAGFGSTVAGTTANFNNSSTNATTYSWDFGDGNNSADTNPSHTYAADGTYTVTLMATNNCGTVTTTETLVIATDPTAGFNADVTSGCGPLIVNFTDGSSSNTTSWEWTFEGGTPGSSTEQNPTVTFSNPGSYTVTLVAGSAAGNSTFTQTSYITVLAPPSAGFGSTTNGTTTTFNNTTTGGNSYLWDFGDGNTSTDPNPQHTYATDGVYTVTLTATNACGSTTATETVTIVTAPTAGFSANVTSGCAPLTVNFTDASSDNTTTWLWTFAGGDPATSTEANPTVTYANPGVYAVSLQVGNAAGTNTASQPAYIIVESGPTAGFTNTQNGTTFDFNNTSTNGDTYSWDFGDGGMSDLENPSHTYTVSGTYTVTLTTTNDCGSVSATQQVTVTVTAVPVAAFSSDVQSGCAPLTVNYTDQSSSNTTGWSWTFEGGNPATSTAQNPQVLYETPGNYTVTLTAINGAGENTVTQNSYIVVTESAPLSAFSTTINAATVDFDNESSGGSTFAWDFGDGNSSTLENPSHTYLEDGTYVVTLLVTNNCGADEITATVVIATAPTAAFSMDVSTGCAPLEVSFTDESSNNTTAWEWTFPGGTPATSTEQNPVVSYDSPGTYDVTLVVTNAQGSDTETQISSIVIEDAPTANFMVSGSDLTIDFNNTSTGATTYAWTFGDGATSMESDPSHTYPTGGDYEVELIVTNTCGADTIVQVVTIGGTAPSAAFTGTPTTGCIPMEVSFTDQSTGAASWVWTFTGGTPASSTEQNPTVTYNTPGVYPVSLSVTNPFGSNSITQVGYIEVGEAPEANFTSMANAGTVDFTNTSTGGDSYAWDFGDGSSSTAENPSHTYAVNGDYTVSLTVTNDCGSSTTTMTISVIVSSTTLPESVSSFVYYPNPTDGVFHLDIEALPTKVLQVQLYDIIGRRMAQEDFDFSSGRLSHRFDWSHLAAGTYVLEVLMGGDVLVVKVVVE